MFTSCDNHYEKYEKLVDAAIDTIARKKSNGRTPIHKSVLKSDLPTLQNLLRPNFAEVNATDQFGNTALHYAVISDDDRFFKALLKHPYIDINIRNQANRTPLHWALDKSKINAITALVQRVDIQLGLGSENDHEDRTCRQILIQKHPKLATKLLKLKPSQILDAFNKKQLNEFQKSLHYENDHHIFYFYADGTDNSGTLLDMACRLPGMGKFAKVLLQKGAKINVINPITGKAAIHEAVTYSDSETVRILRENDKFQVNVLDVQGNSPLHYAVYRNDVEILKILLKEPNHRSGNGSKNGSVPPQDDTVIDISGEKIHSKTHPPIDINAINQKNQTPLHVALLENKRPAIDILLKEPSIDLDVQKDLEYNQTCREIIIDRYPKLHSKLQQIPTNLEHIESLFSLLHRNDRETFVERIKTIKPSSAVTNGKYTYLQYACKQGMAEVVRGLLDVGIDPNEYPSTEKRTPVMIASREGYLEILTMLMNHPQISFEPIECRTVIHSVIGGMIDKNESKKKISNENRKHFKCLKYILDQVIDNGAVDINYTDDSGGTALHMAVLPSVNEYPILRDLLNKGAYLCQKNNCGYEPIESINPSYLKRYLDSCISFEGVPLRDNYKMIFNYRSLIPPTRTKASEIEPLYRMSKDPDLRPLLEHPIIRSYLDLKWQALKIYAKVNLAFYAFFWLILNCYFFEYFTRYRPLDESDHANSQIIKPLRNLVYVSCVILVFRELYQCLLSPKSYFRTGINYLEMILISMTFIFLGFESWLGLDCTKDVASVTIILSSLELITLVGRLPAFSSNLTIVKVVSISCLNFIAWYSILLLGLAFAFSILDTVGSHDLDALKQPATFLYNVSLMVTGHVDSPTVPDDKSMKLYDVLFLSVIFLAPIVNGIALGRTGDVQGKANLLSIMAQVRSIFRLECMVNEDAYGLLRKTDRFLSFIFRRTYPKVHNHRMEKPRYKQMFYRRIRLADYIEPAYHIIISPNERNSVQIPKPQSDSGLSQPQKPSSYVNKKSFVIDSSIVADASNILEARNTRNDASSRNDLDNVLARFETVENSVRMMQESILNLISIVDTKYKSE